jgi:ubiquinone/menaquinone biosynthesis C-methylase UbiE
VLAPARREVHPWYGGRLAVIAGELDRLRLPAGAAILDAGCGTGGVLRELARRGDAAGVDASAESVAIAAERVPDADVRVADAGALAFDDRRFDLVCCLDVIEHVDDDRAVLRELRRVARQDGRLLVTVPAHPSLWSGHDIAAGHRRRYRRRTLLAAAQDAGWVAERMTHFNTLLLPVAAAMRVTDRRSAHPRSHLDRGPGRLRPAVGAALRVEARALRAGLRLPLGLSLLATFRAAG